MLMSKVSYLLIVFLSGKLQLTSVIDWLNLVASFLVSSLKKIAFLVTSSLKPKLS